MAQDLDTTFKFRIPSDVLKAFSMACEDNDTTAAQVLRAAVRDYVAKCAKPQHDLPLKRKM